MAVWRSEIIQRISSAAGQGEGDAVQRPTGTVARHLRAAGRGVPVNPLEGGVLMEVEILPVEPVKSTDLIGPPF